eukprot:3387752-Pyramimonas_sp.AAC.1
MARLMNKMFPLAFSGLLIAVSTFATVGMSIFTASLPLHLGERAVRNHPLRKGRALWHGQPDRSKNPLDIHAADSASYSPTHDQISHLVVRKKCCRVGVGVPELPRTCGIKATTRLAEKGLCNRSLGRSRCVRVPNWEQSIRPRTKRNFEAPIYLRRDAQQSYPRVLQVLQLEGGRLILPPKA